MKYCKILDILHHGAFTSKNYCILVLRFEVVIMSGFNKYKLCVKYIYIINICLICVYIREI